jgi:hypothetical protein
MNIVKVKGGRYARFVLICTSPIKRLLLGGRIVGRGRVRFFENPVLLVFSARRDDGHVHVLVIGFLAKGIGPFRPWTVRVLFLDALFERFSNLNSGFYPNAVSKVQSLIQARVRSGSALRRRRRGCGKFTFRRTGGGHFYNGGGGRSGN